MATGLTSRMCSSTTGSLVFVRTKNRVAIFFPRLISLANFEYSRSCSGSPRPAPGFNCREKFWCP